MKKTAFLVFVSINFCLAQQVVVLDSKSVSVPRYADLTAMQIAIPSPQIGMMVYNIATNTNWMYNGSSWVNSAGAGASQWNTSGQDIYYQNGITASSNGSFSNTINYSIPDNNSAGVISTVSVNLTGEIINPSLVTISMNLDHTFVGDLKVDLISPNGQEFTLLNRLGNVNNNGGWSDNFIPSNTLSFNSQARGQIERTFPASNNNPIIAGTYLPSNGGGTGFVSNFLMIQNELVNGIWSLKVRDLSNIDTGSLISWSINFASNSLGTPARVGVNTQNPTDDLHVNGKIRANQLKLTLGSGFGRILTSDALGNSTWQLPIIQWVSNGQNIHYSNGNVGIGTSTPNAQLQFSNEIKSRKLVLYDTNNNDHLYYGLGINSSTLRYQVDAISADHVFFAGLNPSTSKELFRIKGNGDVGIGNPTPKSTLDVNGSIAGKVAIFQSSSTTAGVSLGSSFYSSLEPVIENALYTLPDATTCPGRILILRNDTNTNNAVINSTGGSLIFDSKGNNGVTSLTMQATLVGSNPKMIQLISDGGKWVYWIL